MRSLSLSLPPPLVGSYVYTEEFVADELTGRGGALALLRLTRRFESSGSSAALLRLRQLCEKEIAAAVVPETVAATGCPQHRSRAGTIMLVSDLALLEDPAFKAVVEEYAADQSLFFEEYASAWTKLQENGVAELLRDEL